MKKNIISKIDLEAEKEALKQEKFRFDGQQEQYEEAIEKEEQQAELEMLEQEYADNMCEDYDNENDED